MVVAGLKGPEDTPALASEFIKSKKRESIETKHQERAAKGYRASSTVKQLK